MKGVRSLSMAGVILKISRALLGLILFIVSVTTSSVVGWRMKGGSVSSVLRCYHVADGVVLSRWSCARL